MKIYQILLIQNDEEFLMILAIVITDLQTMSDNCGNWFVVNILAEDRAYI